MAVHFFHCTDGHDMIVDKTGRDTPAPRDIVSKAEAVAGEIMQALPGYDDWDSWSVHVYDERGEVQIVPFRRPVREAA